MSDDEKVVALGSRNKNKEKAEKEDTSSLTYCSFCGRPNPQVIKMIQGPNANICSECVMICVQYLVLKDEIPSQEAQRLLDAFWHSAKK